MKDFETTLISSTETKEETSLNQLQEIICAKFEQAYHKQTSKVSLTDIAKIALEHSPIDLAKGAFHLAILARPVLFDCLPDKEAKIQFLLHADKETLEIVLRFMKDLELKDLIERGSVEQAVKILENLSERRYRRVLELLAPKNAAKIRELQHKSPRSASRLMSSSFFSFTGDMTIGQASDHIRDFPRIDFTKGVFVVGDDGQLLGHVPGRNLIVNEPSMSLKQVMRSIAHKVNPETSRDEVVDIVERYKVSFLPVVDENNHLVGVISHENVVEAMEDSADETLAKFAGTTENVSADEPVYKRVLARMPWLFVTLIAGFVNFCIMSFFEKKESNFLTFVIFFVPLITGMSGNIGIQCSTVLVRGMAIGLFSSRRRKETLIKEISIGVIAGLSFGILVGVLTCAIDIFSHNSIASSPFTMGIIIGTGLIGATITGTILGVFSPFFFSRIGIDPAIASGPIVTAFNDVLSMTIYFLIASNIGHLFF